MADELNVPRVVQGSTPPTLSVSQFGMAVTVSEFLVTIGHSRMTIPVNEGANNPIQMVEWLQTLTISPQAAILLKNALVNGVEIYESRFGKIPTDPAQVAKIEELNKAAINT